MYVCVRFNVVFKAKLYFRAANVASYPVPLKLINNIRDVRYAAMFFS